MKSKNRNEIITDTDFDRLSELLAKASDQVSTARSLEEKLARATIVDKHQAPADLLTMNTCFAFGSTDDQHTAQLNVGSWSLVYPHQADLSSGRISIFAPLGVALLGRRVGDIVNWQTNDKTDRSILIEKVLYQPEQSGDWHL